MIKNKQHRTFRIVDAETPDEVIWKEFWKDKTPEEKLNITEEIIRGKDAPPRLQRVYRVVERTAS
jgi:hypothetical protein